MPNTRVVPAAQPGQARVDRVEIGQPLADLVDVVDRRRLLDHGGQPHLAHRAQESPRGPQLVVPAPGEVDVAQQRAVEEAAQERLAAVRLHARLHVRHQAGDDAVPLLHLADLGLDLPAVALLPDEPPAGLHVDAAPPARR